MKFELTDKDKRRLEVEIKKNPVRKFLMNKDLFNFEVGDVLVKKTARYNHTTQIYDLWQAEPISSSNKMAQRYVCVHKDEVGIAYLKQLKVSTGKLGEDTFCVTDYDFEHIRFEVDPEYAENIFLDAEFDIKQIHSASLEARKIVTKMNRKSGIKPKSLKGFNDFFAGMGVGDKFWVTADFTARWCQEYTIMKLETVTTTELERQSDLNWRHYKNRFTNANGVCTIDDSVITKITYQEGTRTSATYCYDFGRDYVFFKAPPAREESNK